MADPVLTVQPPMRKAVDLILITDIGMLLFHAITDIPPALMVIAGLVLNVIEVLVWMFIIRPLFALKITEETLSGCGPHLERVSFPRARLDVWRTENLRPMTKLKGYFDLWAQDGKVIRIFRKVFDRKQIF